MGIYDILKKSPIIPVLVLQDISDAILIVKALQSGGIEVIEVTLRTSSALHIIQQLRQAFPKLTIGAGTVTSIEQMAQLQKIGVDFMVSPGLTKKLSDEAQLLKIPYLPGVVTPSEILTAREWGYQYLKFFPAEPMKGMEVLQALQSVFPDIYFCPTGGIDRLNFMGYLALKNVISVGGGWLVTENEVKNKDWPIITEFVRESLELIQAKMSNEKI